MTERSDESTSSLTRTADNNVPRLTPNVSTTLRTNDTTPSVPLVGGPVNNHGPNHQHHHYHGTPPAAPAPGVLHSPAPVAVVRTSRRRRLVHSIGAFMHRISRHASNDPPSTTIRGPATTTAHNAATQDHAQHAQDMSTHLPPPPTLGIDQQREGEVAGRLSSDGDDRDKPLPALPQTCSIDLPQNVVPPASFHRNDTPDRVSPAVPTGQGGSGTHAAAAADSDDAHVANTDYNFAEQPVVRYNDFAFKRWNGFSAPEIGGQASLTGAPARHAETNGHFEEDNLARPNSADFGTNAPLLGCVPLPPSGPDSGLGDQPILHRALARPNTADFGTNAPLLRCVSLPPSEPDDRLNAELTLTEASALAPADAVSAHSSTTRLAREGVEDDLWAYVGEKEVSGMHAGLQLVVIIGSKAEVERMDRQDSDELVDDRYEDAMPQLASFCVADSRHHRLTQLYLCTFCVQDASGRDVMTNVMLNLENYLSCLHSVEIVIKAANDIQPPDQIAIRNKLTHLRHLQIAGQAAVQRFRLFPLRRLIQLDILTKMSAANVLSLVDLANKLELLVLNYHASIENDESEGAARALDAAKVRLPHAMHAIADNPDALFFPGSRTVRHPPMVDMHA
ncbi:hypothetical protein BD626DRAFT_564070 [Schizophyllum amplum]|uniref:Uncharacterized protein n=1 Tax=Schizophyllum amplum TaxID=97359 RepID=A0A550D066_9AGAR|nr:hypothetical protein BD626DRAFT_564070 [Auriculariopsis ampla]